MSIGMSCTAITTSCWSCRKSETSMRSFTTGTSVSLANIPSPRETRVRKSRGIGYVPCEPAPTKPPSCRSPSAMRTACWSPCEKFLSRNVARRMLDAPTAAVPPLRTDLPAAPSALAARLASSRRTRPAGGVSCRARGFAVTGHPGRRAPRAEGGSTTASPHPSAYVLLAVFLHDAQNHLPGAPSAGRQLLHTTPR